MGLDRGPVTPCDGSCQGFPAVPLDVRQGAPDERHEVREVHAHPVDDGGCLVHEGDEVVRCHDGRGMVKDLVLAGYGHEGDPERVSDMSGGSLRLGGPLEGEDAFPENLPGLVGMGAAARLAREEMMARIGHLQGLGRRLWDGLSNQIAHLTFTGHPQRRLPGHVSFWIKYIEGESLLLMLNVKGIMAASGSACSSNLRGRDEHDLAASHVLTAIGVPAEYCSGSLTISLGKDNTESEVDYLLEIMPEVVEKLLLMSPLYADKLRGKDPYQK